MEYLEEGVEGFVLEGVGGWVLDIECRVMQLCLSSGRTLMIVSGP